MDIVYIGYIGYCMEKMKFSTHLTSLGHLSALMDNRRIWKNVSQSVNVYQSSWYVKFRFPSSTAQRFTFGRSGGDPGVNILN